MTDCNLCNNEREPLINLNKGNYNLDQVTSLSLSDCNDQSDILQNSSLFTWETKANLERGNDEGSNSQPEINMFASNDLTGQKVNVVNEFRCNGTPENGGKNANTQENCVGIHTKKYESSLIIETSKKVTNNDCDASSEQDICRICFSEEDNQFMISPCQCKGSLRTVHHQCLETWLKTSSKIECGICKFVFSVKVQKLEFRKWKLSCLKQWEKLSLVAVFLWLLISIIWHAVSCICIWSAVYGEVLDYWSVSELISISTGVSFASLLVSSLIFFRYCNYIYLKLKINNSIHVIQNAPNDNPKEQSKKMT